MNNKLSFFLLLTCTLLLIGCPVSKQKQDTSSLLDIDKVNPVIPLAVTQYQTIDKEIKTLPKNKFILINFWATWCIACQKELPDLIALQNKFKNKPLQVIAINLGESMAKVKAFSTKHKLNFTKNMDIKDKWHQYLNPPSLPLTLLVNKNYQLVGKIIGARNWQSVAWENYLHKQLP